MTLHFLNDAKSTQKSIIISMIASFKSKPIDKLINNSRFASFDIKFTGPGLRKAC